MARAQTWTRNVSKRRKGDRAPEQPRAGRPIVGGDALESLRRRAEDWGLILHGRGFKEPGGKGRKNNAKK